jgi:hypothetical protein
MALAGLADLFWPVSNRPYSALPAPDGRLGGSRAQHHHQGSAHPDASTHSSSGSFICPQMARLEIAEEEACLSTTRSQPRSVLPSLSDLLWKRSTMPVFAVVAHAASA